MHWQALHTRSFGCGLYCIYNIALIIEMVDATTTVTNLALHFMSGEESCCYEIKCEVNYFFFLAEDLRLQRNIDNYSILRRCSTPSTSSKSSTSTSPSSTKVGKPDSPDPNLVDRTEFLITRVSQFNVICIKDERYVHHFLSVLY